MVRSLASWSPRMSRAGSPGSRKMIEKEMMLASTITGIIWKTRCRMYVPMGASSKLCQVARRCGTGARPLRVCGSDGRGTSPRATSANRRGTSPTPRRGSGHPGLAEVPAVGHDLLEVRQLLVERPVPVLLPKPAVPGLVEGALLEVHVHLLPLRVVEAGAGFVDQL